MKRCSRCHNVKAVTEFTKQSKAADGLNYWCKACRRLHDQTKKATGLLITVYSPAGNFKISRKDYNDLWVAQGGKCAICQKPDDSEYIIGADNNIGSKRLAVDHCHATGEVRGLLCTTCNTQLGWFEDNMEAILLYLKGTRLYV